MTTTTSKHKKTRPHAPHRPRGAAHRRRTVTLHFFTGIIITTPDAQTYDA
jgi:hypothetical protein